MSANPTATQAAIDAALAEAATVPTSAAGDFGSATNRSIDELIKLDRYNRAKETAANGNTGLTVRRMRASGAHS